MFSDMEVKMEQDYSFIAQSVAGLCGVPVRIYKDGAEICRSFPVDLPCDPAEHYMSMLSDIGDHVGYYCTPYFHYYGVLNAGSIRIIVGPTSQVMANEQKMRELAFESDVPPEDIGTFTEGMNAIRRLPVEKLLQILCTLNYFLNSGEKLRLSDLAISESVQEDLKSKTEQKRTSRIYEETGRQQHNTLNIEKAITRIVRKGDTIALRRWLSSASAVHGGTLAGDQLRHMKNLFIVTATLVSRAAIQGGMYEDDAFSLSDAYIQRAELLSDHDSILNLQYHMLLEFTEQVGKLRRGDNVTGLSLAVANYVRHHLSEPISVEKMAEEFFLSRPYLSAKFRQETGQTLTDFILNEKTEEAKRLIRYTDKSLSAISAYLGFSSQSHFIRVFRKYAGTTPGEYLGKYRRRET